MGKVNGSIGAMVLSATLGWLAQGCLDSDPCPGQLECSNGQCCPTGFPYYCDGQCWEAHGACGASYITCGPGGGGPPDPVCGEGTYWDGTACQLNQSLQIVRDDGYWHCQPDGEYGLDMEFFSSGNGKVAGYAGAGPPLSAGAESFTWQSGGTTDSVTVSDNSMFSMLSGIVSSNQTSFSAQITTSRGTTTKTCSLASGTF